MTASNDHGEAVIPVRTSGSVLDFPSRSGTRHPAGRLTPFTARVISLAHFIADHRMPDGDLVLIQSNGSLDVVIDLTGRSHVQGAVREWAQVLEAPVTAKPEATEGRLWRYFETQGRLPDGTFVRVVARELVTEAVS